LTRGQATFQNRLPLQAITANDTLPCSRMAQPNCDRSLRIR
jgi:hypothetical protein